MKKSIHADNFFRVKKIDLLKEGCVLTVVISPQFLKTSMLPGFSEQLLLRLPKMCDHHCDNQRNLTFPKELEDTEVAHAFEHALIDMISQQDKSASSISGLTYWNWRKESRYSYRVLINYSDQNILLTALAKTIILFREIFDEVALRENLNKDLVPEKVIASN